MHDTKHTRTLPGILPAVLILAILVPAIFILGRPGPAPAQDAETPQGLSNEEEIQLCLCRNVLARTLCKDPTDFSYVASYRDGTHTFTVFYANQQSRVLCQVSDAFVHIKAELNRTLVRSVEYTRDPDKPCASVDYQVPECPADWTITCCAQLGPGEQEEQKELEFWNRPIPEILRDELESGMAREQNASDAQPDMSPAPQQP